MNVQGGRLLGGFWEASGRLLGSGRRGTLRRQGCRSPRTRVSRIRVESPSTTEMQWSADAQWMPFE